MTLNARHESNESFVHVRVELHQSPVGVREVDVVFSFFVVGTWKIYFVMNLIVQNLTNLAVTPTGVWLKVDLLALPQFYKRKSK